MYGFTHAGLLIKSFYRLHYSDVFYFIEKAMAHTISRLEDEQRQRVSLVPVRQNIWGQSERSLDGFLVEMCPRTHKIIQLKRNGEESDAREDSYVYLQGVQVQKETLCFHIVVAGDGMAAEYTYDLHVRRVLLIHSSVQASSTFYFTYADIDCGCSWCDHTNRSFPIAPIQYLFI